MDRSFQNAQNPSLALAVKDFFDLTDRPAARTLPGPHNPRDFAERLFAYEALDAAPQGQIEEKPEPYSLQWFLDIENQRHSKHARWIPRLLEFAKHAGENLLGLGHGLGTDWVQYARHGAKVLVCTPSSSQLELIRRNFQVRGLPGRFVHAAPDRLPLENASIDVACISSLWHGIDDPQGVADEVLRVLKPGGKVLVVTPARFDVDFWFHTVFFWYRWVAQKPSEETGRRGFSGRQLRKLFGRFVEHRLHKRQLRRPEVPQVWRWLPLPLLARLMGRVLILKAFKPLSVRL
ncbi:MAG: class I SAM-dependent methyltransferase [Gemmataceae bacterium]|nr:class I SAM-dependent methyltransferase [Gemmataceae bacterium]MCI0741573.1 class I SAM-dependent methyltransferase [Gemmataceae bacterium]